MVKGLLGVGLLVGLLLASLSHARVAQASDDELCETVTARSAAEIIVPFGDPAHPRLPTQAVKLLPGESVCLTGDLDRQGQLVNLRLALPDTAPQPRVALSLEQGRATQLLVSHSSPQWLYYGAAVVVTQQDLALLTNVLSVGPGMQGLEDWDEGVRKLLLFDFRFGPPPQASERRTQVSARRQRDTTKTNLSATFGFWGGERTLRLAALEQALARDGFGALDRVGIQGGLDLDFALWRVRAGIGLGGGGRSTQHRLTGKELSTWMSEVTFHLGFDLVSYRQFRAFATGGLGVADLYVDRPASSSVFAGPREGDRAKFQVGTALFDIGAEYFFPFARASASEKWLLQVGTRLGWVEQLGNGGWTTTEQNGRALQGPPVDLSGFRARLVIGIGAQNGW
jgi:hypothetical protein